MTERNNSVVQAREKFMNAGGVFLGEKEWNEILEKIPEMYDEYRAKDPFIDYCGYNFADEVFKAGYSKTGHKTVNGKWEPFFFEVRVRKDGKYYNTLVERNDEAIEKASDNSEILGYLAWQIIQGDMDFKKACMEFIRARV